MAGIVSFTADGRMTVTPMVEEQQVTVSVHNVCPKCGKESRSELSISASLAPAICGETNGYCDACRAELDREEMARYKQTQFDLRVKYANIPPAFTEWKPEIGNQTLARKIRDNRTSCLYIAGPNSTGKTRAAAINLYYEVRDGKRVRMYRFSDLAADYSVVCKNIEREPPTAWLRNVCDVEILLIDDICKRRITETAGEMLYDLTDLVYSGEVKCRIWITANRSLADLADAFANPEIGDAVASRIDRMAAECDGRMKIIEAKGK